MNDVRVDEWAMMCAVRIRRRVRRVSFFARFGLGVMGEQETRQDFANLPGDAPYPHSMHIDIFEGRRSGPSPPPSSDVDSCVMVSLAGSSGRSMDEERMCVGHTVIGQVEFSADAHAAGWVLPDLVAQRFKHRHPSLRSIGQNTDLAGPSDWRLACA